MILCQNIVPQKTDIFPTIKIALVFYNVAAIWLRKSLKTVYLQTFSEIGFKIQSWLSRVAREEEASLAYTGKE